MAHTGARLIFVYNANGGIANGIVDSIHKTLSPSTYGCSLCAMTHGVFRMDPKWHAWIAALPMPAAFHHKDDNPFENVALPVVMLERDGKSDILLSADALGAYRNVDSLIAAIESALQRTGSN